MIEQGENKELFKKLDHDGDTESAEMRATDGPADHHNFV